MATKNIAGVGTVMTEVASHEWYGRKIALVVNEYGFLCVLSYDLAGNLQGQPVRFKYSDGRVGADLPGVDSAFFHTDSQNRIAIG